MKVDCDGVVLDGPNLTLTEYLVSWLRDSVVFSRPKTLEGYEVA
jgi:hypothetical protein